MNSTIAAIATPPGHGGIGIIKLSGPQSVDIALSIFRPKFASSQAGRDSATLSGPFSPKSRYLYYGHVVDADSENVIDEVLLVVMRGPRSYTTEDVVEIQSHAGPVVLKKILNALIKRGIRLADPGEFTRRAFLNGRIDLTQAEAVVDIINARSEKAVDMAVAQVSGELNRIIQDLRASLIESLTYVEAAIDFPDEVDADIDTAALAAHLDSAVFEKIHNLISRTNDQNFLRDGLKIVIIGAPNVGKSSLMNRLVDKDRSIVTDIPGTTRDFIEDAFVVNGVPVVVTDTAGLHETPDPVEQIGMDKAWAYISGADILLFTVDAGNPVSEAALTLFTKLEQAQKKIIIVVNKTDLPDDQQAFQFPAQWQEKENITSTRISALYNRGIDELKSQISNLVFNSDITIEDKIVPNLRHKLCLENALSALKKASDGLEQSLPFELIAIDLTTALDAVSEITGETVKPDILDNIFSRFCIGK